MLTIINYHYVRDLSRTRYPQIKGLPTQRFEGQLDYITKHYTVCSVGQVVSALKGEDQLPPYPCLLTFDDGLVDHYVTVFPRLEERGIVGGFYPPAATVDQQQVLDVHKIQFILASVPDSQQLVREVFQGIQRFRGEHVIPTDEKLHELYAKSNPYDTAEVVLIKRILQKGLPDLVRSELVRSLFRRYVSEDEQSFASELYLDLTQVRCMQRHGMDIGGHGVKHEWIGTLSPEQQEQEVLGTADFLRRVYGDSPSNWVMSYPSGSYDDLTLDLLKRAGFVLGLTDQPGLVSETATPFELKRLDTNFFPFSGDAAMCEWTDRARRVE